MQFEKNIKLITQRWPELAEQLHKAQQPERLEAIQNAPAETISINGIQLSSRYDRQREAQLQAGLIPHHSAKAWVYGLASGDLPRCLLRRAGLRQLTVVLLNPEVERACLGFFEHADWLGDERVSLVTAAEEKQVQFPFACAPAGLYLADDASARLRDQLHLELATPYIRGLHNKRRGWYLQRFRDNEAIIATDGDVAELFGAWPAADIVVVAAGPTLADQYEWLLKDRAAYRLIAVDMAARSLLQQGLVPDVIVSMDSSPNLFAKAFASVPADQLAATTLVYSPFVFKSLLDFWPGKRLVAYAAGEIFSEIGSEHYHSSLFSSGSVLHPAVDLAVQLGGTRIILAGADFSYPKQRSHVAGAGLALDISQEQNWVINGQGERVPTSLNFRGYLRDLESYIQQQPEVQFFNSSLDGAKIEGTTLWKGGF